MIRGAGFVWVFVLMMALATGVQADIYVCKRAAGTEIYTNQSLGEQCRKLENLPKLIPAPPLPSDEARPGEKNPASPEVRPKPAPGGGHLIDPPSDQAILVRDVKAIPNYSSRLGTARYQADMRLTNGDTDWTAAQVCIDVRFRDLGKTFIDVHKTACLEGLKPLDDRPFTVIYTGTIPPRMSPIEAEVQVSSVKWVK